MSQVKDPPVSELTLQGGQSPVAQSLKGAISGHMVVLGLSAYEFVGDIDSVGDIPDAKYNNWKNQSRLVQ